MSEVIKNRYEFVVLFDVENGNPRPLSGSILGIFPASGSPFGFPFSTSNKTEKK